jgi:hypothetical protein
MPAPCIRCDLDGRTIRTQGDARTDAFGSYVLCPHRLYRAPIGPLRPTDDHERARREALNLATDVRSDAFPVHAFEGKRGTWEWIHAADVIREMTRREINAFCEAL